MPKKSNGSDSAAAGGSRLLVRAIEVLEAIAVAPGPQGVHELARTVGVPVPTVFRIAQTLCHYGWLDQAADGKYSIGMSAYTVGCAYNSARDLADVAYCTMQKLSDQVEQPVNLMVRRNNEAVLIQQTFCRNVYSTVSPVGSVRPLYLTACGKLLMGDLSPTLLARLLESFDYRAYTPNSICEPEEVRRQVEKAKNDGYAMDNQESMWGAFCVAAPIRGEDGKVVAAVSVTSVSDNMKFFERYLAAVKEAAVVIEGDLRKHIVQKGALAASILPQRYETAERM